MKLAKLAPLVAVIFVGAALGGRSYAYFTAGGTGVGAAEVGGLDGLNPLGPVGGGATTDPLLPGGKGDVVVVVQNPNTFAVDVVEVRRAGAPVASSVAGCGLLMVLDPLVVPVSPPERIAGGAALELRLPNAAHLDETAPNDCQGATFTIPVIVEIVTATP